MDKETCKKCEREIELLPRKNWVRGKSKWIHSPIQKGQPMSRSEVDSIDHDAIPKNR